MGFMQDIVKDFVNARDSGSPLPAVLRCNKTYEFTAKRIAMMLQEKNIVMAVSVDDDCPDSIWTIPKEKIPGWGKKSTSS